MHVNMRRAEEHSTTSSRGGSGLSGPRSRLGLVRAMPPHTPSSEFIEKKEEEKIHHSYVKIGLQDCLSVSPISIVPLSGCDDDSVSYSC